MLASLCIVVLCGVMVSVLAIGPSSNFAEGHGLLRAIKIRNTCSYGGKVKLSTPFRTILWYVRESFEVLRNILRLAKFIFFASSSGFASR
jgi:hypothetical protein